MTCSWTQLIADLYERLEDLVGENEVVEDHIGEDEAVHASLLNLSQEGAGFHTQMAIGLSLSEVEIIFKTILSLVQFPKKILYGII